MTVSENKVIKNVFVSAGENYLKLVDIYFSNEINRIVSLIDQKIPWSEISDIDKKSAFIEKLAIPPAPEAEKIYDGRFNFLIPGAVDPHVHFDTPGYEFREDFEHASTAAAFGGVTTVIDMPCTSIPAVTDEENFVVKKNVLRERSLIDFAFWGGVRGNDFEDGSDIKGQIKKLAKLGVVGFKVYCLSGMNTFTDLTYEQIDETAEYVNQTNLPLAVHAEDRNLVAFKVERSKAMERKDWDAYCKSRDIQAETEAIAKLIAICGRTRTRTLIVHLSSQLGLNLIRKAKQQGIKISAETCPHYLTFTQEDFTNPKITAFLKTAPPVKFESDRNELWNGLADGSISFVSTDHAGCDPQKEKSSENFWEVYGGIPGVEHRVPFLFSEGFLKNRISLEKTVELLSVNPAKYFRLSDKGSIEPGKHADFALINLWKSEKIESGKMHSKGKYTPFDGLIFNSVVETTFLRGNVIMNRAGDVDAEIGYGKIIK